MVLYYTSTTVFPFYCVIYLEHQEETKRCSGEHEIKEFKGPANHKSAHLGETK